MSYPCRFVVIASLVFAALAIAFNERALADEPTAKERYQQFLDQVEAGQHDDARVTYRLIDDTRLSAEERKKLHSTMLKIDQMQNDASNAADNGASEPNTGSQTSPASQLKAADMARANGNWDLAVALYTAVKNNSNATAQQQADAQAGLAEVTRRRNTDLATAQLLMAQAQADLAAGRIDAAAKKVAQVEQSSVQLGWNDQERLSLLKQAIAEHRDVASAVTPEADGDDGDGEAKIDPVPTPADDTARPQPTDPIAQNVSLQAQMLVARGDKALERGDFGAAKDFYDEALKLDPANREALEGRQRAVNRQPGRLSPQDVGSTQVEMVKIRNAQTEARFNELMSEARSLLEKQQFDQAEKVVTNAKFELKQNPFFPRDQFTTLWEEADDLAVSIRRTEEQVIYEQKVKAKVESEQEAEAARIQALRETRQRVDRLLRRANELRAEQRYDHALELLNQAYFLEPHNVAIKAFIDTLEDSRLYVEYRKTLEERSKQILRQSFENADATIPWTELMTYPSDWPQLTQRRLASLQSDSEESEVNRRTAQKLKDPVPLTFPGDRLFNVLDFLRSTTGVDIYVNWPALRNAGVDTDTIITMDLKNVPADKGLELILEQASAGAITPLGYAIVDGIVRISTQEELRSNVETKVYDIRDLLIQVPNFSNAPEFSLDQAINNDVGGGGFGGGGGGGGGGGIFDGGDGGAAGDQRPRGEVIAEIIAIIQDTVGRPEDWKPLGGPSDARELSGNLIVRTTSQNHREIIDLLAKLREARTMQIHVETRFLIVTQNFLEEIGMDVDLNIRNTGSWGDVKLAQDSFGITARPSAGSVPGSFGLAEDAAVAAIGAFVGESDEGLPGFPGSGRALDISAAYLDDIEVTLLLRATKAHRETIALSAPRVTFFNGQTAYVMVVTQTAFVSDLEPVSDADGFDPTLGVVNSGVVLQVTGTISADRRYVTLTVTPRISTVSSIEEFTTTAIRDNNDDDDDDDDDTTDQNIVEGSIQVPTLQLTEIRTTVSVPDKGTLLLGGQRLVQEVEIDSGVPILADIPILNRLFANSTKIKDERTLLMLIKPTIIIQSEEEELTFPGLLQDPANYGIGQTLPQ